MKKQLLYLMTICLSLLAWQSGMGQTTIAAQSFEGLPSDNFAFTPDPVRFSVGADIWTEVSSINTISPSAGSQFWGMQDLENGNGGRASDLFLTFTEVDITAFTNVTLSFDYNAFEFDGGDDLGYDLIINGTTIDLGANNNLVDGNSNLSTSGWETETINISADYPSATTVGLILIADQNGGGDYAGFDNIVLEGTSTSTCNITASGLTSISCNDNSTLADATDDRIVFILDPTVSNPGASGTYEVTASSGSVTPSSASYGASTQFILDPGTAGGGDIDITIEDTDNGASCQLGPITVTDPGSCSPLACAITGIDPQGGASACNDNGTPSDPSDDYYEVTLRVTYNNPPGTGTLSLVGNFISGGGATSINVSDPGFGASQTDFVGVRLPADGVGQIVAAQFSATSCSNSTTLTAVNSCSSGGVISAGDLVITEIMQNPNAETDPNGEYFEIYNPTGTPIDLNGCDISDAGSDVINITSSLPIAAGGYLVFGRNATGVNMGGVTVDFAYGGSMALGNGSDELIIDCGGTEIDRVEWDNGATFPDPVGASMNLNFSSGAYAANNNDGSNWCESLLTISGGTDLGTPGSDNSDCATCNFTTKGVMVSCDNNTTPNDATDDTWTFSLDPQTATGTYDVVLENVTGTPSFTNLAYGVSNQIGGSYNILEGNILVSLTDVNGCNDRFWVYAPETCSDGALSGTATFYTDPAAAGDNAAARTAANGLNDNYETQSASGCKGGTYTTVYADLDPSGGSSCSNGVTTIVGTVLAETGTDGTPITVTINEITLEGDNGNISGFGNTRTGCGTFNGNTVSNNTYQSNSPAATEVGGLRTYYNSTFGASPAGEKAGVRMSFSQAVNQVSFYMGDVESRTDYEDGYAAVLTLFNGPTVVKQMNVPTATANQDNCNGDGGGSFSGCGNSETVFFEYFGTTGITDIVISVGEIITNSTLENSNIVSFAGLSCGGNCVGGVFPVEWISFEGQALNQHILLEWETANEVNNKEFVVERSIDQRFFSSIGTVPAASANKAPYTFLDNEPNEGVNYYRLKQVDLDGTTSYSQMIEVNFGLGNRLDLVSAYPNPTSGHFHFDLNVPVSGEVKARILNPTGQIVWEAIEARGSGQQSIQADLTEQASGIYFYELRYQGQVIRGRFLKQ